MARTLALTDIDAGDRIRPVDDGHAQAIGASITARGLINRIGIRHVPNGKLKWKLVTGAHRLRGLEIAGLDALSEGEHFVVLKVDADEARLIEAEENLARNDLTVLERALTVLAYRRAWERKFGPIKSGPRAIRSTCAPNSDEPWPGDDPQPGEFIAGGPIVGSFSEWAAERLGLSRDAYKRLMKIAKRLPAELVAQLRGTPAADQLRRLTELADMTEERRQQIAAAMALGRTLDEAIEDTDPYAADRAKKPMWEKRRDAVVTNYKALNRDRKLQVLDDLAADAPEVFEDFVARFFAQREAA